jgi:hypothetical protein
MRYPPASSFFVFQRQGEVCLKSRVCDENIGFIHVETL